MLQHVDLNSRPHIWKNTQQTTRVEHISCIDPIPDCLCSLAWRLGPGRHGSEYGAFPWGVMVLSWG